MAIAGGVNLILAPETTVALSQAHMLAPDGRSKAFDDRADGFARAEGCGVAVLKPLSKAQADGDRIFAVVRGSAINQDGASSSLTAPNGPAQEELMRKALRDAGVGAAEVGYVEAHGTGTELGDPIELQALGAVYGAARAGDERLLVGSLKTNFGHMEAAAGIGGLIKLVLSLEHGEIPAHLQFETPTKHVKWDQLRLDVPRKTTAWPHMPKRVGAVSSFGFSGTNAHLIVEQAPGMDRSQRSMEPDIARLLPISAKSEEALRKAVSNFASWLGSEQGTRYSWADIAASAGAGRDHYRYRTAVVARSGDEAASLLGSQANAPHARNMPSLCFLFTGQGSERSGMGLALLERSEVFRAAVDRLDRALGWTTDRGIAAVWANHGDELERASLVQPALYAYGWALSELWRSWGVMPQVVLGHSLGEFVAATVAGVMTPEQGIRLVAARGRLTEELGEPGGMLAIVAQVDEVRALLTDHGLGDAISVAAVNGPSSVVVSGRVDAIETLESKLADSGLRRKRLKTTHGFHSAALDGLLDAFEAEAANIAYKLPELKWISNLTGSAFERREPVDARYWRRHLRESVQFQRGLEAARTAGADLFVELGAEPQLLALAEANGIEVDDRIASVSKSRGEWESVLTAAGKAYVRGVDLDWVGVGSGNGFRGVPLPGYPFERRRYWFTDQRSGRRTGQALRNALPARSNYEDHPLLGTRLRTRSKVIAFQALLSPDSPSHLGDHVVQGKRILPGAAYLEMALAAAGVTAAKQQWFAEDVEFREPCVFDEKRLLETSLGQMDAERRRRFEIASTDVLGDEAWRIHATGYLVTAKDAANTSHPPFDIASIQGAAESAVPQDGFYGHFDEVGLNFGPAFKPVQKTWGGRREALVEFELLPEVAAEQARYGIHPIALDACLQAVAALIQDRPGRVALPAAVARFGLYGDAVRLRYAFVQAREAQQGRSMKVDVFGLDRDGECLLEIQGLALVELRGSARPEDTGWLYEVAWERVERGSGEKQSDAAMAIDVSAWETLWREKLQAQAGKDVDAFDAWMVKFDRLCAAWIAEKFAEGGFELRAGREFVFEDVMTALRVMPRHRLLAKRLLEVLVEFGYLRRIDDVMYTATEAASLDVERVLSDLRSGGYAELDWTERTVRQMLALLSGKADPVEVLFGDGGQEIATRLYRGSLAASAFSPALAVAAADAARQIKTRGSGLARVLEIGGGTAGMTNYVVPALSGLVSEYVWTDIGAGFVSAARREFSAVAEMRFQTLDIEVDPALQGMGGELFDIVVASNVLHATVDLRVTLRHVRSLLRPGGVLLLAETVGRHPWVDLTVGFTDGWWRFRDHDLRAEYPLIERLAWKRLLGECGFGEATLLPESDDRRGVMGDNCLIAVNAIASGKAPILIVSGDAGAGELALSLQAEAARDGFAVDIVSSTHGGKVDYLRNWFAAHANSDLSKRVNIFYLAGAEIAPAGAQGSASDAMQWQEEVLGGALAWTQALLKLDRLGDCRMWLVSRGASGSQAVAADGASLAGFVRSVRAEHSNAEMIAVDLATLESGAAEVWRLSRSGKASAQYSIRGHEVFSPSLKAYVLGSNGSASEEHASAEAETLRRLVVPRTGLLGDMRLTAEPRRSPLADEVEIAVEATAINFHEVLDAVRGGEPHDCDDAASPGAECSGVVVRVGEAIHDLRPGDAVVAIGRGLMAEYATLSRNRIWKRATRLNPEESATLLIPFLTARWSLEWVAKLQPGERVLIHSAAGGLGLAAIQEARRLGAIVIATAGSDTKRQYLRGLGIEHVFDSRSVAFEQDVLTATDGRGVDVVLNSLAGDKVAAGLRTLAPNGRFIELAEDTWADQDVHAVRADAVYARVHLRAQLAAASPEVLEVIGSVLEDVDARWIDPLPSKAFPLEQASEAFRYMAAGQHIGRVLVTARAIPQRRAFGGIRRDGAYVASGAFAGLGLLVVEWLADRGAGCVLALGRSEPSSEAQGLFASLRERGTEIVALRCDVSDEQALTTALSRLPGRYKLRGVFHSAGVLDDGSLENQTWDRFQPVLSAKIAGAWNLHRLTSTTGAETLDCFVMFSSVAGVLGSRGQANHAAANAWLDGFAHYRRGLGLPALSIDWGAWSGTGAAVRHGVTGRSERAGASLISPEEGLRILSRLLEEDSSQVMVLPMDWKQWSSTAGNSAAANADLLRHVLQSSRETSAENRKVEDKGASKVVQQTGGSWRDQLLTAPHAQRRALLEVRVEERVRTILSLPAAQPIDAARPLHEYGLDSLLAIELRNAISLDLGVKLSSTVLFDYPTMGGLTDWLFRDVLKQGSVSEAKDHEPSRPAAGSVFEDVAELTEDEVELLFQQKIAGMSK
jgi:acyl transferase domain-containing protein/NADPH:quinone reductase-like Zn-dependent oxidoreductase/acyl carrier protein